MNGQILQTTTLGRITVTNMLAWGAQGEVYHISNPDYLLKVWRPEDVGTTADIAAMKKDTIRRYHTFARLNFGADREVTCLPLEYLQVDYDGLTPAYLMRRATGQEMQRNIRSLSTLSPRERLHTARSLANTVSFLHARQVVHADFKPGNFFYDGSGLVQILDVDGGGYFGSVPGTEQFWPSVVPIEVYKAPELVHWSWKTIWNTATLRKQPDLWSLAVMLYQTLVDINGPFPTKSPSDDSRYEWFRAGDYARDYPEWPRPRQKAAIEKIGLNSDLVRLFEAVFRTTNRMRYDDPRRPEASRWRASLDKILAVPTIRQPIYKRQWRCETCGKVFAIEPPRCDRCGGLVVRFR